MIKKLYPYIIPIIFLSFLCSLLFIHKFIFPNGDDWCEIIGQPTSFFGMIQYALIKYNIWTGRFIVSMTMYVFLNNISVWRLLNPVVVLFLITIIVIFSSKEKLISIKNIAPILLITSMLFLIDPQISKEALFWITGSINYLWSTVCALIFLTIWFRTQESKTINIFSKISLIVFGVISGNSHEQTGAIVIIFIIGSLFWKFLVEKKKTSQFHIIVILLVISAYLILLFAPGNIARAATVSFVEPQYYTSNLYEKVILRAQNILFNFHSLKSVVFSELLLFLVIGLDIIFSSKKPYKKNMKMIFYVLISPYTFLILLQFGKLYGLFGHLPPLFDNSLYHPNSTILGAIHYTCFLSAYLGILFYGLKLAKLEKDIKFLLLTASILSSQSIMLFSPISPFRTFFITIVLIWCSIVYVFTRLDSWITKQFITIISIFLTFLATQNYITLSKGFRDNNVINIVNEAQIKSYLNNGNNGTLALSKLPHDEYIFGTLYSKEGLENGWEAECFKVYYGLEIFTPIEWHSNF